jgi:16S rRNA (guanine527-N7)-methyltransferase
MREELSKYNIDYNPKYREYFDLLRKWNRVHSITNINKIDKFVENIYDSIYPLEYLDDFETILDIGSGAGFPAIPIAIATGKKIILCEPLKKRYSFLNFLKLELNLNIEIYPKRVETIRDLDIDLITSRAVTDTNLLLNLIKNINYKNVLLYKGSNCEDILNAQKIKRGDKRVYIILGE